MYEEVAMLKWEGGSYSKLKIKLKTVAFVVGHAELPKRPRRSFSVAATQEIKSFWHFIS